MNPLVGNERFDCVAIPRNDVIGVTTFSKAELNVDATVESRVEDP